MVYLGLGVFGFILLLLFDFTSLAEKNVVKYFFGIGGFGVIVLSSIFLLKYNSNIWFPLSYRIISLILAILSFLLLIYSVFIEVGENTYKYKNKYKLITTGTYALSRHPGVLWFLFVYLFIGVYFQNYYILFAGLIWTCINIIYVWIQERFIFIKIFDNYAGYIKTTPMLLPNFKSLERCITTLKWRK